jgi:hypothetical protein
MRTTPEPCLLFLYAGPAEPESSKQFRTIAEVVRDTSRGSSQAGNPVQLAESLNTAFSLNTLRDALSSVTEDFEGIPDIVWHPWDFIQK